MIKKAHYRSTHKRLREIRCLLAFASMALAFLRIPVASAQLQVTTSADEDDGNALPGNGTGTSLREAVNHASPGAIITFAPSLPGRAISVTNGLVSITNSITIDGSALPLGMIVNGHGRNSLFHCGSQTTNALIGLTLTGGHATVAGGGAILNDGVLVINQCTFTNNTANEAGAIFNFATLTVNNSTFVGNRARFAGAIEGDGGPITLNHCTLTGNISTNDSGAILNFFNLTLNHCTIVSNQASYGGGINNEGSGTMLLNNCIVAANTDPQIVGNIEKAVGVNLTAGNPMLAPLGDYGGPTPTMPPLPGSPAIDPVGGDTNSVFTSDQRGASRVINGIVDVGAVEVQLGPIAPIQISLVQRLANGSFHFSFTNRSGATFEALATTDLAHPMVHWLTLGPVSEIPPASGLFHFTHLDASNFTRRFYRVRSSGP